jgi:hypothetical protein
MVTVNNKEAHSISELNNFILQSPAPNSNTYFSSLLINWTNELECLSLASPFSLDFYNTLAYFAYSEVTKKMKCCE